ncbi:hypothetical protein GAYE_SCF17G3758 [Galdieria yellowstonensis]|uniref:Zinc finger LSD1-type domain-containing protein n=1 Tax=Galdieria yellowstonensis TaxID=3028027 RepID=A0AAV9IEK6_9RHOD|nr:hypothetical protein GAYE_SCF17G3758 [Galdieria yellowstonensis]
MNSSHSLPVAYSRNASQVANNTSQGQDISSIPSAVGTSQRNSLPVAYSTDTYHHNPNERSNRIPQNNLQVFTPDAPRNFHYSTSPLRCMCPFCGVLLLVPRSYGLIQCGNCHSLLSLGESGAPPIDLLLQSHSIGTCYGCNRFIIFPSGATSVRCGGCGTITVMTPRNMLSSATTTRPTNQSIDSHRIRGTVGDNSRTNNNNNNGTSFRTATNSLDSSNVDRSRPTRHCICRHCGIRLLFQGSPQRVQCGSCGFVTTLIEPLPKNSGIIILENPWTESSPKLLLGKLVAKRTSKA